MNFENARNGDRNGKKSDMIPSILVIRVFGAMNDLATLIPIPYTEFSPSIFKAASTIFVTNFSINLGILNTTFLAPILILLNKLVLL